MFAENFGQTRVLREIHKKYPEHRPDGDSPVTLDAVRHLKSTRKAEVKELRVKLNERAGDELWIANRFSRLKQLQNLFEDANRWVPKRLLRGDPEEDGGPRRSIVVYEKDTGTMIKAVIQAREELGEDADSRQAQSLEDMVRLAEAERGLAKTEEIDVTPADAVPKATDVELVEGPRHYPSKGDDIERGLLDGDTELGDYVDVADEPDEEG